MEINVLKDFDQINISSPRHVNNLINALTNRGLGDDTSLILNLCNCQTDYPETPRLIDYVLEHLAKLDGNKELKVIFNGLGNKEVYILHDLILDGNYFGIHQKINSKDDISQWVKTINSKLKNDNIIMTVIYEPEDRHYIYGE